MSARLSEPGFFTYVLQFDICCLLETFTPDNFDFDIYFDDYVSFHFPGKKLSVHGRRSGGVVVLVRKRLKTLVARIPVQYDNVVVFRVYSQKPMIVICAYIPPADSPYYGDRNTSCNIHVIEDVILKLQEQFPEATMLLCGDLNARLGDWQIHSDNSDMDDVNECICDHFKFPRTSQDKMINLFGSALIDLCRVYHFCILNGSTKGDQEGHFTFISAQGESVVDYCLVSAKSLQYDLDLKVASRIESDHMPLEVSFGQTKYIRKQNPTKLFSKIQWNPSKVDEFMGKIYDQEFDDRLRVASSKLPNSAEDGLTAFMNALSSCAEFMRIESKSGCYAASEKKSSWFDLECKEARREARGALMQYKVSKLTNDKDNYVSCRGSYKRLIREKKKNFYNSVRNHLMATLKNSKEFWATIRRAARRTPPQPVIEINVWKNHFENLFKGNAACRIVVPSNAEVIENSALDAQISTAEVKAAINSIKTGKAPGLDGIPGECYKAAGDKIVPFLVELFNTLFEYQYFPQQWCQSIIVPIHKKGNKSDPDNYRGISLLPILSKVFSSIIARRFRIWLELEEKICPEQAGFRPDHSTIDHVFTLYAIAMKHVYGYGRGKLYVAFVDFRKAFDSVDRDQLWKILYNIGLSTKFLNMLKAMYCNVQSCVRWNQELSDLFTCPIGVKQGAKESTSIFLTYINIVADYVRSHGKHGIQLLPGACEIFALLFADDIVLLSSTPTGLQNQLNSLEEISKNLNLKVNVDKTRVMVFRRGGYLAKGERWYLHGTRLETVNSYKYLGFAFTTKLSMNSAVQDSATKGKQKTVQIMKTMWSLHSLDPSVFLRLFDSQVQSSLLYGSEIWGFRSQDPIEKVHMFACKKFLGLDVRTPNHLVYGELARYPLMINGTMKAIKYWLRLSRLSNSRLPKQAYTMLLNSKVPCKKNWALIVRDTLCKFGFGYVWMNGGIENERRFLRQMNQRLQDCFLQSWDEKNRDRERYSWYSSFKDIFGFEQYLTSITIKKFRDALVRFRFGINILNSNKRFGEDSARDNSCPFCSTIEDEKHFLLNCTAYNELRKRYIIQYIDQSTKNVCTKLMQSKNVRVTRNLSMYIYYGFKLREAATIDATSPNDC